MDMGKVLELLKEKHPGLVAILVYDDGSGRITSSVDAPYDEPSIFEFGSLDTLYEHLQEEK